MLFDNIDWYKRYEFTLILTKKNKKPLGILHEAYSRSLDRKLDGLDQFSFTIPYYIEDEDRHTQIKNPNYDNILVENMVLIKCGDIQNPAFQSYFIIKTVTESDDKLSKKVECTSRECSLNKNVITLDGVERQLNKDSVQTGEGIFDILAKETSWKLGHIDETARTENLTGIISNKYRWFDSLSKPWYDFLITDVATAFNIVIMFDTVNKLVNVYDRDSYGKHTGIILSNENYIKETNKKSLGDSICTKLEVSGRDGLIFDDVNPLGTDYILNYDYFKQNGQMSDELTEALNKWNILINQKNIEFQALKTQIDNINSQIITKNSELSALNEELKGLNYIRQGYIESSDNDHLPQATANVNDKATQIGQKQNEINSLNNQITTIQSQMTVISSAIDKTNAKDTYGNLIFNSELLEELEDFTYTESWENNYYADSTALLKGAQDILKDWSVSTVQFDMKMVDFFAVVEEQKNWSKIQLGDFCRYYSTKFNDNIDVRIVGYTYNIDSNDLSISFSNKDKKVDDKRNVAGSIKKASEGAKIINVKKLEWNDIAGTKNAVEQFLNNNLDVSRQQVISQLGKNKINITENGIFVINADDENQQIGILSGLIAITQDGWQSCGTCLNSTGVFSKYLVGQILLGEQLYIADALGIVTIESGLIKIKDANGILRVALGEYANGKYGLQIVSSNGQVILDETGLLQTLPYTKEDNVDQDDGLEFLVYIPPKSSEIRKVSLSFKLLPFRAYEKSAASGGTTTSEGGGGVVTTTENTSITLINLSEAFTGGEAFYTGVDGDMTKHKHSMFIKLNVPDHKHTFSLLDHFHNIAQHVHNLVFGIFKSNSVATGINIYVDGVLKDGSSYTSDQTDLDITTAIGGMTGWHNIRLTSTQLGRINATIIVEAFVLS